MPTKIRIFLSAFLFFMLIVILAAAVDRLTFTYISSNPSNRELSGEGANSECANGIAFDGTHWYYSNQWNIYRLAADFKRADRRTEVKSLKFGNVTSNHVGGIDYYGGELYAALQYCSDGHARVAVFDSNLLLKRVATLPELDNPGNIPWVAVNPLDNAYFYTVSLDGRHLLAFERNFPNGTSIRSKKTIQLMNHPQDVLGHFVEQGGAFSKNGLFYRVVDDLKDEDSDHTGIWIYEISRPLENGATATRVGFIHIRYDPDKPGIDCPAFTQCYRNYELEDLDASSITSGLTAGDLHIIMLSNETLDEDDVSIYHFSSFDYDQDNVRDSLDNCIWNANPRQEDSNSNGIGDICDYYKRGVLSVRQTYHGDLDKGRESKEGADFWFWAKTATERYLMPENGALFAIVGDKSFGYPGCSKTTLSSNPIPIQMLTVGTFVCVRTSEGRIAEFRVEHAVGPNPDRLEISYTIWDSAK